MTLEFLPEAVDELEVATAYYETCVSGLGVRFRKEIERGCQMIMRQPLGWRERRGGFRRFNLTGFPYYLAYFLRGERLVVAALAHASRHPDYWKKRELPK